MALSASPIKMYCIYMVKNMNINMDELDCAVMDNVRLIWHVHGNRYVISDIFSVMLSL